MTAVDSLPSCDPSQRARCGSCRTGTSGTCRRRVDHLGMLAASSYSKRAWLLLPPSRTLESLSARVRGSLLFFPGEGRNSPDARAKGRRVSATTFVAGFATRRAGNTRSHRVKFRRLPTAMPHRRGSHDELTRKTALVAGLLYLITFVSTRPCFLQCGAWGELHVGPGRHQACVAAPGTGIVALAGTAPPSTLYPVVKRPERRGRGWFVRKEAGPWKASWIFVGVFSLLSVVALRRAGAGRCTGHRPCAGSACMTDVRSSAEPLPAWSACSGSLLSGRAGARILPVSDSSERPCSSLSQVATFRSSTTMALDLGVAGLPIALWSSAGVYLTSRASGRWPTAARLRAGRVARARLRDRPQSELRPARHGVRPSATRDGRLSRGVRGATA